MKSTEGSRFGHYMVALREQVSIELEEAAALLGVQVEKLSQWERGQGLPSMTFVEKISEVYKVPVAEFSEILKLEIKFKKKSP